MIRKRLEKKNRMTALLAGLIVLEVIVFAAIFLSLILPSLDLVFAAVGENNVTVTTSLAIGNVFPEIINVTINNYADSASLTANATTAIEVYVIARDFNGEFDIQQNLSVEFFDNLASSYGAADDNNNHYTNTTCAVNTAYGDQYEVNATCIFNVEYYANNATWNATAVVFDNSSLNDSDSDDIVINALLALGLPSNIDFGEVNATAVSEENITNVTNFGNVQFNLSLSGYGHFIGDGYALNCTLGAVQNISIEHEKFNLTVSNESPLSFTQADSLYRNLSSNVSTYAMNIAPRTNDTDPYFGDTNQTYWRVYVPTGVAGTCSGHIVFGAIQAEGEDP